MSETEFEISREIYKREVPLLREYLLNAQFELVKQKNFSVIVVIAGLEGSGKARTLNKLTEWMDPRLIQTHALRSPPSDEENERPPMWRYWRKLPPKGHIAIFLGGWYTEPLKQRLGGKINHDEFTESIKRIRDFERMLLDEGVLILKYWLRFDEAQQKERIEKLESNETTSWRITSEDKIVLKRYRKIRKVFDQMLEGTHTEFAPWEVIENRNTKHRELIVGKNLLEALKKQLCQTNLTSAETLPRLYAPHVCRIGRLSELDLSQGIEKKSYKKKISALQERLGRLTKSPAFRNLSVICVFEGPDAAGKGGCIRRIAQAVDSRIMSVIPIAAPTDEEIARPYLWRFWRNLPNLGSLTVFDRSWYGRVLVERIEGFCSEKDWSRGYDEINDFELQMVSSRFLVIKFWLHISKDEQQRRFDERSKIPFKRFKLTEEDWRNRDKWESYEQAACDMFNRTSTDFAPWTIVEANDKYFARIKVLDTVCNHLEAALKRKNFHLRNDHHST